PEVEVAARNLRRWAAGKRIRAIRPRTAATAPLVGARVRGVRRVGKNLLVTLEGPGGPIGVWSHLGMTGKWLRRAPGAPAPRFTRLALELDGGARLHFADMRRFGRFRVVAGARFEELPALRALGPDPLIDGIDAAALQARLARLRVAVKVALLDQRLIAGV